MEIKRLIAVTLILSFCIIFVACGEEEDDGYITPRVVAEPITDTSRDMNIIQQPAAFFLKQVKNGNSVNQTVERVYSSGAEAYIKLLTEVYGFELFYEDPGYVYNEYYFVHPDNHKQTGENGEGYDIYVQHVYASSTTATGDWMNVTLKNDKYTFGDLGFRFNGEKERQAINGKYAANEFKYNGKQYYNSSDRELSVRAGMKRKMTYIYTKPSSSTARGFYGKKGACCLIINGGESENYYSLIADYRDINGIATDMISVFDGDDKEIIHITWEHNMLEVGKIYTLSDFLADSYWRFEFEYDEQIFDENSALCITIRPLILDRDGKKESVVYFYGEFESAENAIYTVEGLIAATFCLEETSEAYTEESEDTSSGDNGGHSGVPDHETPDIPEHSKLNCLTCKGDGDCNSCGGSGVDYYGGYKTKCNTCRGSGKCRACGGSGKR